MSSISFFSTQPLKIPDRYRTNEKSSNNVAMERSNTRRTACAPRNSRRSLLLSLAKPEFKYLPDVWCVYHFVNLRFTVVLHSRSLVRSRRRRLRPSTANDLSRLSPLVSATQDDLCVDPRNRGNLDGCLTKDSGNSESLSRRLETISQTFAKI